MGKIRFVSYDGQHTEVELKAGKTLMQHALDNAVAGIDADCGGGCACGTCHVFVDQQFMDLVGEAGDMELSMLAMAPDQQSTSRLSCQIDIDERFDGLTVHLPEFQM